MAKDRATSPKKKKSKSKSKSKSKKKSAASPSKKRGRSAVMGSPTLRRLKQDIRADKVPYRSLPLTFGPGPVCRHRW